MQASAILLMLSAIKHLCELRAIKWMFKSKAYGEVKSSGKLGVILKYLYKEKGGIYFSIKL